MSYSDVYKNLDHRTIDATKMLIKGGLWKDISPEQKIELCEGWLKAVSGIYGVEAPEFKFDTSEVMYRQTGGGYYEPLYKRITLFKKFSLTTLLHEFRHYMQYEAKVKMYRGNKEEDARAWSCSLYKAAAPKSFQNAVDKGILHFH